MGEITAEQRRQAWLENQAALERNRRRAREAAEEEKRERELAEAASKAKLAAAAAKAEDEASIVLASNRSAGGMSQTIECFDDIDETPLECRGLGNDYEGSFSLLDSLLVHGLPGLSLRDVRALAQTSKAQQKTFDDNEVWRLCAAAAATEYGLYAPAASPDWKK